MPKYKQLTLIQRYQIEAFYKAGFTQEEIAMEIKVHKSTISRELRRNRSKRGYRPEHAHKQAQLRKKEILCYDG